MSSTRFSPIVTELGLTALIALSTCVKQKKQDNKKTIETWKAKKAFYSIIKTKFKYQEIYARNLSKRARDVYGIENTSTKS